MCSLVAAALRDFQEYASQHGQLADQKNWTKNLDLIQVKHSGRIT